VLQAFDSLIQQVGPVASLFVLGLAALLEYLFPPFPGDSVMLLGGIYAVRGQQPYWLVFTAVMVGSVLGALANFSIGQWLGARVERDPKRKTVLGISMRSLHDAEARMRRYGDWLIAVNRFVPGIRGLFFVAAGMAGMRRGRVLVLGAISAAAHSALFLFAGVALGGNAERITAFMGRSQGLVVGLVAVAALAVFVRWLATRRKKNGVATP